MNKKYQIFVSSTFRDLIEERQAVLEAILELNHIPCGMEAFPANNSTPFELIKKMIDDSDYYVLIIGGRYGSINHEGISYTESEYDYAVETKRNVLCFIHGNPAELLLKNTDTKNSAVKALEKFKQKVSKHIVKTWSNKFDLKSHVLSSLSISFQLNPMSGWVKLKDEFAESFLMELNVLQKKYNELQEKYNELIGNIPTLTHHIKNLRHNDSSIRLEACKSLGYMGIKAKDAVPELISTILFDASSSVKVDAIEALRDVDTSSTEAVECLVASLKNKEIVVRKAAAKALGSIPTPSNTAIEALIDTLSDKEVGVQACCMESLILLDKNSYSHVVSVLQYTLVNRDYEVRTIAFKTVMYLDVLPEEIQLLLIRIFYLEFDLTGENISLDDNIEVNYQIIQQTIKVLACFEKKGQSITGALMNEYTPEKKIYWLFAKMWHKEYQSTEVREMIIYMYRNEHFNDGNFSVSETISQIAELEPDIIPLLKKHLQLNPVDKVWIVESLLKLDSTLKPDLLPFMQEATKTTKRDTWLTILHLLKNHDFEESDKYPILINAIFNYSMDDQNSFYYDVVEPALKFVLPYLLKDPNQFSRIKDILYIVDSKEYGFDRVRNLILDSNFRNREVLEIIWNRQMKEHNNLPEAMDVGIKIIKIDSSFLPVIQSWFNAINSGGQLYIMSALVEFFRYNLKHIAPIILDALNKGIKIKYEAVKALKEMGPDAIQYIPYLQNAKKITNDNNLKVNIDDAIRIIEDI